MPINVPVTVWRPPPPGSGEMTSPGTFNIADSAGNLLVDSSTNFIVDTGQLFTQVPVTLYTEDDSK